MIINMTPHAVNIITDEDTFSIPPSGKTIRLSQKVLPAGTGWFRGYEVPFTQTYYGDAIVVSAEGESALPYENGDDVYIVSAIVKAALSDRSDLVVPAELVRDTDGKVIGCRSLGL